MEKIFENENIVVEVEVGKQDKVLIHHKHIKGLVMRVDITDNCIEAQSDNDNGITIEWTPTNARPYYALCSRT